MNSSRLALVLALLVTACATPGPSTDYLDNDGYTIKIASEGKDRNPDIVRVVRQEQFKNMLVVKREAGSDAVQHPQQLDPAAVSALLKQIKIRRSRGEPELLFDDDHADELREFSAWLSEGLALAGPDNDLLFHYPQNRGLGLIRENLMTTGRVFVSDGKLNIIFGDIQEYYEGQWLRAKLLPKFKAASRKQAVLQGREVVNTTNAKLASPARKDWVQISLTAVPASAARRADGGPAAAPAPASASDRLLKLKDLHDKGLITNDEFEAKRKQIIDGL